MAEAAPAALRQALRARVSMPGSVRLTPVVWVVLVVTSFPAQGAACREVLRALTPEVPAATKVALVGTGLVAIKVALAEPPEVVVGTPLVAMARSPGKPAAALVVTWPAQPVMVAQVRTPVARPDLQG